MLPSHQWYGPVPGQLIFLAMIAVALALFARRAAYLVRLLLTGKPTVRWDAIPSRLGAVLVYVLGQLRLITGDFAPGVMHAVIFWGFIVLTLGTAEYFGLGLVEAFSLPLLSDTPGYLILQDVFNKSREEATRIMYHVHQKGVGECGVYPYEVAETKVTRVMDTARKNQHPLQCVMEKQ